MGFPFCKFPPSKYDQPRSIIVNYSGIRTSNQKVEYPSNFITTSKYTFITFLPLSLLGQFRRYANIYFLFIAIIQSIPSISPLNPVSAIAPLVFVLGLSMLREGIEDFRRHQSDNEVNAMACTSIVNSKKTTTTWAHLKVGDLLLIKQDEMFPADLVVLGSQIESGACYIETSSLDGEKNLKPKSAIQETQTIFNDPTKMNPPEVILNARGPTQTLYEYEGGIKIASFEKSLNQKQLLLRGAFLRNTDWIIGAVVYTGMDTKIMRNAEPGRIKTSSIESTMNRLILGILMFQVGLCILSAVLSSWWLQTRGYKHTYVYDTTITPTIQSILVFFSYFLLYNTMIPISLIVSMEFVKVFQAYFIERDKDMYVLARDKFAKCQTTTINEELGQIEYIFTDKTGTLTCNQMEFKYCIIGNVLYGKDGSNQQQVSSKKIQNGAVVEIKEVSPQPTAYSSPVQHEHSIFTFKDDTLKGIISNSVDREIIKLSKQKIDYTVVSNDLKKQLVLLTQKDLINEYLFLLSSAHECIVHQDKETGKITYQGPSPDEITLVDAAMNMGFKFNGASASTQEFEINGIKKQVGLLYSFEFDSTRKRMSVIINDNGIKKLFIKGADNIINARLSTKIKQPFLEFITGQLDEFSKIGLRTLLMAMKVLSDDEFLQFDKKFNGLKDSPNLQQEIDKLTDELERDLYLLGATAVEDKLQDQVPETIADLLKANIKIWMLTGDKLETAENIARSCRLITEDMTVMRFQEKDSSTVLKKIQEHQVTYSLCIKQNRKKSFLVEGDTLAVIIENNQCRKEWVKMSQHCESVVCCRVTPKQKAQVVKLIKDNLNVITLAIGDGANDVNMIQAAHIGIGLYGNEGMRAVQSSDFALGEFRCLWRLVLVHGHWSYIRIAEMILYFFYKNMIFTIPQFFFAFFSAYSAQTFFDDWYITFYNLFFTALPLIARATFDQDINYKGVYNPLYDDERKEFANKQEEYLKNKFPKIYYIGQKKTIFTIANLLFWIAQGLIHGIIVFFVAIVCFDFEVLDIDGITSGFAAVSIIVYTSIIFIVDIKIAIYTKFWTWINFASIFLLSILIYAIYFVGSNYFLGTYSYDTPLYLLYTPVFYLMIVLLNGIVFIFDVSVNQIIREIWTSEIDHMLHFKSKLKKLIHDQHVSHHHSGKNGELIKFIEDQQREKRENGLDREWGDSFFEDLVDTKYKKDREMVDFGAANIVVDDESVQIIV